MLSKNNRTILYLLAVTIIIIPTLAVPKLLEDRYHETSQQFYWLFVALYGLSFLIGCYIIEKIKIFPNILIQKIKPNKFKLIIMITIVLSIISISFLPNFIHHIPRGVARTTYGLLGPIITFSWQYLMPLLCLDSYIYWKSKNSRMSLLLFIISIFLAFGGGIISGYKSAAIMAIFPLLIYITNGKLSFKTLFFYILLLLLTGVATILLTTSQKNIGLAISFIGNRIFTQTGYGLSAAVNDFSNGGNNKYILFEIFGSKLTTALGIPFDFHMATALSISFYGPTAEVLSRQANVTPSPLGEGIYLFGIKFAWIHALLLGSIFSFMLKKVLKPFVFGGASHRFWLIVFVANGLTLINGSSIFSLVSLPNIVYLSGLCFFVYWRGDKTMYLKKIPSLSALAENI